MGDQISCLTENAVAAVTDSADGRDFSEHLDVELWIAGAVRATEDLPSRRRRIKDVYCDRQHT